MKLSVSRLLHRLLQRELEAPEGAIEDEPHEEFFFLHLPRGEHRDLQQGEAVSQTMQNKEVLQVNETY